MDMDHSNLLVELGLAALSENAGQECITEENLTHKTISALQRHPENLIEIVLTSLILLAEQEADSKLLAHVLRVVDIILDQWPDQELRLAA